MYWNEYAPGQWEPVEEIDQNPRPAEWVGIWNPPFIYHYVGKQSGLLAMCHRGLGLGANQKQWFTPDGEPIADWSDYPDRYWMVADTPESLEAKIGHPVLTI